MKKSAASKTSTGMKPRSRATLGKQSTGLTTGTNGRGLAQNSFTMATSQSTQSLMNTRLGYQNSAIMNGDSRRSSQQTNFATQAKLMGQPGYGKMDHRTPSGIGFAHRPSNATMDRPTAMHSGMPSPSTTMFKKASFNQSTSNRSTANLRFTA